MLDTLLSGVRNAGKSFTVYADSDDTGIAEQFATRNVDVEHEPLPPGKPDPFLVIREHGGFAGAIGLTDLADVLEPPVDRPARTDDLSDGYRVLFELLDETVFRALTRRELLAVSREIEDRAFRVGTGTLRAGFQRLSKFEAQADVYRLLATETNLDVHVYGDTDWAPPSIPGVTYHRYPDEALERYWVLGFVGGTTRTHTSALVAREHMEGYEGFWTDDEETTRTVMSALEPP